MKMHYTRYVAIDVSFLLLLRYNKLGGGPITSVSFSYEQKEENQ
jgi:hypothetical protein